jgi:di/tripeptidase
VLNEIVNRILEIRVPRRPATNIVFGTVKGGVKFGSRAMTSRLGLEIHSTADVEVERIYSLIEDIAVSVACEQRASVNLERVSTVNAANLGYGHPLVKNALSVLRALNIEPLIESSESELSLFPSAGIPAITLGLTYGTKYHLESSTMSIEALLTGVAQLVALIKRIDEGACDGE